MPDGPVTARPSEPAAAASEPEVEHHGLGEATSTEILPKREPFRTLLRWLSLGEQTAGVALLIVILVLVLLQVAQRYLPGGAAWTGELARFAMVWATFVMAGYLLAHDQHVAIKVLDYVLPVRALAAVRLFGHLLIAITCIVQVYATYDFTTHDRGQVTAAAEIPLTLIYTVVAFGFASTALRAVVAVLVLDVPEVRSGRKEVA